MKFYFSLKRDSIFIEFYSQCILIDFLSKPTPKCAMDFHSSTYNVIGFLRKDDIVAAAHIRLIR